MSTPNVKFRANLALASICIFWGTTYAAIAVAVKTMPPMTMGGLRFVLAGFTMVAFALWQGQKLPDRRDFIRLSIVGILLLTIANLLVVWSEQYVPSSLAALIVTGTPFFFVGSSALLGDKVHPMAWVGMVIGFLGIGILFWPKLVEELHGGPTDPHVLLGCLGSLAACATWSVGSVYAQKRPADRTGKIMAIGIEMAVAGVLLCLGATIAGDWKNFSPSTESWLATLYLVTFGSWVGFGSYVYCLAHLPPERITIYSYVNPIVAVFLGWALLHEEITLYTMAGSTVVLGGVVVVNLAKRRPPAEPPPGEEVAAIETAEAG